MKIKYTFLVLSLVLATESVSAVANNVCTKFINTIEGCMKSGLAKQCEGKTSCVACDSYFNPTDKKKKEFEARLNEPCNGPKKTMSAKRIKGFKSCEKDEYVQKSLKSQIEMLQKIEGCK